MTKPVRKAVLPVAGLGTRFLPATKAMAKEMLTIFDRPLIQYAVEECLAAGIEQFVFVTGRNKQAIEDHFDRAYELEDSLAKRQKKHELEIALQSVIPPGKAMFTRQQEPLGLGHAVWCAREFIGDEPFAVLLPDELTISTPSCTAQLVEAHKRTGGNVISVVEVPKEQTHRYGIVATGKDDGKMAEVTGLVEKPKPEAAPSRLAIIGRYILTPTIFETLERTPLGAGGELQLTDGLRGLLGAGEKIYGYTFEGKRHDAGDKLGFLKATVEFALKRPDLGPEFAEYLRGLKIDSPVEVA